MCRYLSCIIHVLREQLLISIKNVSYHRLAYDMYRLIYQFPPEAIWIMYQSIPSATIPPGTTRANSQNLENPDPLGNFFLSNAVPPGFPGTLYFDKFYTFPPLSRSQSSEYLQIRMEIIYLSIENM